MAPTPTIEPDKQPKRERHVGSRLLAGLAFGTVGAKIGFIGSVMDVNSVLGDKATGFVDKLRACFDGRLKNESLKQILEEAEKLPYNKFVSYTIATLNVAKYSTIITVAGIVAGTAIGVVRGNRVENWKDIIFHPWRSTKVILGAENPELPKDAPNPAPVHEAAPVSTDKWKTRLHAAQDQATQRAI